MSVLPSLTRALNVSAIDAGRYRHFAIASDLQASRDHWVTFLPVGMGPAAVKPQSKMRLREACSLPNRLNAAKRLRRRIRPSGANEFPMKKTD